ncbi:MAG: radical SAM family heme chaperone HemW, partial [Cyanobacteria bacterium P01_H01_bin.121]
MPLVAPRSAYLHIPFCRRRCYYCDFPIAVIGDAIAQPQPSSQPGSGQGIVRRYLHYLQQEIALTAQQLPSPALPLQTVFFGGGTPSLLTPAQLETILTQLQQVFGFEPTVEISIEMDPGTFDREKLLAYKALGVNRVSLGVQVFQDQLLQTCGRSHSVADVYAAIELLRACKISNWSLDLISGLPHQTLEDWQASLEAAIALNPPHISAYDLVVEEQTVFGKRFSPGEQPLPTDTSAAAMYRLAQRLLTQAGYEHYEISNYAKPGCQCQHNRVY